MTATPTEIGLAELHRREDEGAGYCLRCREFTVGSGVPPAGPEVDCPECGEPEVVGVDAAVLSGLVTVSHD